MALYNKYRPNNFEEVCGQNHIKKVLSAQVLANKLGNSYLFTGPAGCGKTSVARIFSAMINSSDGITITPLLSDTYVKQILSGKSNSDVYELDAATSRKIDDIRELRTNAVYAPLEMRKKIFIIDECHQLTSDSWEALLKIIEEPPAHLMFIFCTTRPEDVPETIETRCMSFEFRTLSTSEVHGYLKKICDLEKIVITDDALKTLALYSNGSLRRALSVLEKVSYQEVTVDSLALELGTTTRKTVLEFIKAVTEKKYLDSLQVSTLALNKGVKVTSFIDELAMACHDIAFSHIKHKEVNLLTKYGYTESDLTFIALVKELLIKEVGEPTNLPKLIREWINILDINKKQTVLNLQPQYIIDMIFMDFSVNMKKFNSKPS